MTIEKYLDRFKDKKPDTTSETFRLMARLVNELLINGVDVGYIEKRGDLEERSRRQIGDKFVALHTVYRSNATKVNKSVDIDVYVKISQDTSHRIGKVRVRVDASDKVINKRIDTVVNIMMKEEDD